jgi:hypothetical protein
MEEVEIVESIDVPAEFAKIKQNGEMIVEFQKEYYSFKKKIEDHTNNLCKFEVITEEVKSEEEVLKIKKLNQSVVSIIGDILPLAFDVIVSKQTLEFYQSGSKKKLDSNVIQQNIKTFKESWEKSNDTIINKMEALNSQRTLVENNITVIVSKLPYLSFVISFLEFYPDKKNLESAKLLRNKLSLAELKNTMIIQKIDSLVFDMTKDEVIDGTFLKKIENLSNATREHLRRYFIQEQSLINKIEEQYNLYKEYLTSDNQTNIKIIYNEKYSKSHHLTILGHATLGYKNYPHSIGKVVFDNQRNRIVFAKFNPLFRIFRDDLEKMLNDSSKTHLFVDLTEKKIEVVIDVLERRKPRKRDIEEEAEPEPEGFGKYRRKTRGKTQYMIVEADDDDDDVEMEDEPPRQNVPTEEEIQIEEFIDESD